MLDRRGRRRMEKKQQDDAFSGNPWGICCSRNPKLRQTKYRTLEFIICRFLCLRVYRPYTWMCVRVRACVCARASVCVFRFCSSVLSVCFYSDMHANVTPLLINAHCLSEEETVTYYIGLHVLELLVGTNCEPVGREFGSWYIQSIGDRRTWKTRLLGRRSCLRRRNARIYCKRSMHRRQSWRVGGRNIQILG